MDVMNVTKPTNSPTYKKCIFEFTDAFGPLFPTANIFSRVGIGFM